MTRFTMKLMILCALFAGAAWSQCTGTTDLRVWAGTYASSTAYALCNVVYNPADAKAYVSGQAGNQGHQPETSGTYWTVVYSSPVNLQSTDTLKGSHIAIDYNLAWLRANGTRAPGVEELLPSSTVAALPDAASAAGKTYLVTDCESTADCSTGGGTARVIEMSAGTVLQQSHSVDDGAGGVTEVADATIDPYYAWRIVAGGEIRVGASGTLLIGVQEEAVSVPSVLELGGKGDGAVFVDGSMNPGSSTFTSPSSMFTASSVGKLFMLFGAGPSGGVLSTTIAGYTSAHVVTLASAASTAVTTGKGAWGTDNSAAIAKAISVAVISGGWRVDFPAGIYLTSQTAMLDRSVATLHGGAQPSTILYANSGAIDGTLKRTQPLCNEGGCSPVTVLEP